MHTSSIIQICINYTYTSVCTVKSLYMYCCTRRGNEKKMCLCLQLEARNPPTQRIHRGKMQPKSLTAFQRERNAGKGRERVQKRNRNHLSRYTSAEVRCQAGGERCTPGYASGTRLHPGRLRCSTPVPPPPAASPRPYHLPAAGVRAGRGRPARRRLRPPRRVEIGVQRSLKHRGGWQGRVAAGHPAAPPAPAVPPCASRCRPRSGAPRPRRCW